MSRLPFVLLALTACAGDGADTSDPLAGLTLVTEDPSDSPIDGLSDEWAARFADGDAHFEASFREAQGLGPAYIRASCEACHADDARGPGIVTKMVVPDDAAADAELLPWGHTERPHVAGGASTPLLAPDDARVVVTTRTPPAVFGRGWLEAIDEDAILALAEEQAAEGLVSGAPNLVVCAFDDPNAASHFPGCTPGETVLGRFGLKARIPTLDGFAADAYQGDMAITSPMRSAELPNPDGLADDAAPGVDIELEAVNVTADYMRLLAIPGREAAEGSTLFGEAGCDTCHVPALPTRADWPVPQIAGTDAPVFTDMLLHDMGEGFSDGLTDGLAGPSEWRTAPLVGLRHLRSYLHDGRAATVEDAVVAHGAAGSEALFSAERFAALSDADRATLLAYVESL